MPLLSTQTLSAETLLGLWHIKESVAELEEALLYLRPNHALPDFKAESRRREWLAVRVLAYSLLDQLSADKTIITREETGQPVCVAGGFQVSLTHSGPWVAALVSGTYQVGIDIETRGTKVPRLVAKFLSEEELTASQTDPVKMHLYWSAKETLYKAYSRKKLLFKENLLLENVNVQPTGQFKGTVQTHNFRHTYDVHYIVDPEYVLTYVLAPLEAEL
ncbi:4'-phosphopantetheinyl transferase superfamily protein [Rufibacter sp. LB8]|uniref:4'-phosphopantetheinyl transferase superfamily protein n=1 Tax=Rufibacter sp. LB8 TaxID=2777781 RepID=UPI00178C3CB1|nr:4'-phosphopantetheinyl transferase superfamily protein [Rufibacter sp. LB8]